MHLPPANSGSIALATSSPAFQSEVSFTTAGTDGLKNPRVWIAAYQDGVLVYGEGGSPGSVFKLGGDSSQWVTNGGGPAECTAELYYILNAHGNGEWTGHGDQGGTVRLAEIAFNAGG